MLSHQLAKRSGGLLPGSIGLCALDFSFVFLEENVTIVVVLFDYFYCPFFLDEKGTKNQVATIGSSARRAGTVRAACCRGLYRGRAILREPREMLS